MSQENVEIVRGVRYRISRPRERASRRRSLDERFFVRIPGLYRLLADRLMRLPPLSQHRLRHRPRKYLAGGCLSRPTAANPPRPLPRSLARPARIRAAGGAGLRFEATA